MTDQEKKDWIMQHWKVSDGKTIAAMLRRYWKPKDLIETAQDLFGAEAK